MSAFIGVKLFSEFLLDGGYHPESGMQALPDALSERFKDLGGTLLLSCRAKNITVAEGRITGVELENHGVIPSPLVVSGCDARQTYLDLIGRSELEDGFYDRLTTMLPSISNYILYLGLDSYFETLPNPGTTLCFFSHYDLDKSYRSIQDGDIEQYGGYMFYVSDEKPTILAIIPAPFNTPDYWTNSKERFGDSFIERLEKHSIPHLSRHIVSRDAATPATLYRYTLNYQGASYGWAGTPSQFAVPDFKKASFIQGLYLTGHWTTHGIGISGVIYVGQDVSKLILSRKKCCKI
jgi:prolycopene isomerase